MTLDVSRLAAAVDSDGEGVFLLLVEDSQVVVIRPGADLASSLEGVQRLVRAVAKLGREVAG